MTLYVMQDSRTFAAGEIWELSVLFALEDMFVLVLSVFWFEQTCKALKLHLPMSTIVLFIKSLYNTEQFIPYVSLI